MPIAMAASTVFSFLCRRFLTAIMHGFERRFLFPAHGCFCGGCCPRCPRACSGLGRAALCFSRWFLDLSAPPFFGCGVRFSLVGFFWFLGGVLSPLGRPLRRRGGLRSVAARAVVVCCAWPGRGVWCVWHAIHCRASLRPASLLQHSAPHYQAKACLVLPPPTTEKRCDCPLSRFAPPDIAPNLLTECIRHTIHQRMHHESTH